MLWCLLLLNIVVTVKGCNNVYFTNQNVIIKPVTSSGYLIQSLKTKNIQECEKLCCDLNDCNAYLFHKKLINTPNCVLIFCGPKGIYCKYFPNPNFISGFLPDIKNLTSKSQPSPIQPQTKFPQYLHFMPLNYLLSQNRNNNQMNLEFKFGQQKFLYLIPRYQKNNYDIKFDFKNPTFAYMPWKPESMYNQKYFTRSHRVLPINEIADEKDDYNGPYQDVSTVQTMDDFQNKNLVNDNTLNNKSQPQSSLQLNDDKECNENFEFKCLRGKPPCIAVYDVCDGITHCQDGSDEIDCPRFITKNRKHKMQPAYIEYSSNDTSLGRNSSIGSYLHQRMAFLESRLSVRKKQLLIGFSFTLIILAVFMTYIYCFCYHMKYVNTSSLTTNSKAFSSVKVGKTLRNYGKKIIRGQWIKDLFYWFKTNEGDNRPNTKNYVNGIHLFEKYENGYLEDSLSSEEDYNGEDRDSELFRKQDVMFKSYPSKNNSKRDLRLLLNEKRKSKHKSQKGQNNNGFMDAELLSPNLDIKPINAEVIHTAKDQNETKNQAPNFEEVQFECLSRDNDTLDLSIKSTSLRDKRIRFVDSEMWKKREQDRDRLALCAKLSNIDEFSEKNDKTIS